MCSALARWVVCLYYLYPHLRWNLDIRMHYDEYEFTLLTWTPSPAAVLNTYIYIAERPAMSCAQVPPHLPLPPPPLLAPSFHHLPPEVHLHRNSEHFIIHLPLRWGLLVSLFPARDDSGYLCPASFCLQEALQTYTTARHLTWSIPASPRVELHIPRFMIVTLLALKVPWAAHVPCPHPSARILAVTSCWES